VFIAGETDGCCAVFPHRFKKENNRMKFSMSKLRPLIACGLVLFSSDAAADNPIMDLPMALAAAKEQGKPVFIYLFDSF
jgi:hypothetical protein